MSREARRAAWTATRHANRTGEPEDWAIAAEAWEAAGRLELAQTIRADWGLLGKVRYGTNPSMGIHKPGYTMADLKREVTRRGSHFFNRENSRNMHDHFWGPYIGPGGIFFVHSYRDLIVDGRPGYTVLRIEPRFRGQVLHTRKTRAGAYWQTRSAGSFGNRSTAIGLAKAWAGKGDKP